MITGTEDFASIILFSFNMLKHALILSLFCRVAFGATCELIAPLDGASGPEFGFIFTPGAQVPGEKYKLLAEAYQRNFPGRLWVGLTENYFADFPNPLEIGEVINQCRDDAAAADYDLTHVFNGGHSLGGVVLEAYMTNHANLTSGLILYGSYLPDLTDSPSNVYPVPVLTAIGTLDAGVVSYALREAKESALAEETNPGWYPVFMVDRVNHGQVFDGGEGAFADIEAEIPLYDAHDRYSSAGVAFMVTQYPDVFESSEVAAQRAKVEELQAFTDEFLAPFEAMLNLEESPDGTESPWVTYAQKAILNLTPEEEESISLTVTNNLVTFGDLGSEKPTLEVSDCAVNIVTISHPEYDLDPVDAGAKTSARVIKGKMKLEDTVLESACLPPRPRKQCKDLNEEAFQRAWEVTSDVAKERFTKSGKSLVFVDDQVSPWGPGWEFSGGLTYTEVSDTVTELEATSLISEEAPLPSFAFMHYCDFLSPLRALEWIYLISQSR